ncbi:AAA family ATPase [Synechococcus sp. RSCCF101]|uniref:AAA family ATPase n=1 Tax=Synechococcus sp. RSCCF101 TaxID=2511069 RepID=UPI00124915B9|nr:AAA family ATPase [Synechococcus sp. RSCCF101]QEY32964.1 AAA family ATPase [Synechococcus sp. RSCCF101]
MSDLFSQQAEARRAALAPLADRLRPRNLEEFVGQGGILEPGRLLRRAIVADRVGNLILHGPPGVGKTTLARIIANTTRARFRSINAVLAGVKDLRAEVEQARERLGQHGLRTILFIDEVHRFNAAQQDALLPWVENGTLTLIGATTENPYFEVNKALLSRSRLFRLQPLLPSELRRVLQQALQDPERGYGQRRVEVSEAAADHWIQTAAGDARCLLNALELAVESTPSDAAGAVRIDLAIAEDSIQERAVLYDKQGDAHYDTISAFIKSLRGSDPDAALFWLARMVEAGENPRFIFRRMLIAAGEDVGLADPMAVVVVEACAGAFERVGLPEGLFPLAQAALYLAGAEKSNSALGVFDALKAVRQASDQEVPSPLRDANRDREGFGDGVGYRYPHAYTDHWVAQRYLPAGLAEEVFWQPGRLGWEGQLRDRLQERRAAQLATTTELEAEQPLLLSHGPEDPGILRWISRQLASEGDRLIRLKERLWQGARWRRHDRVLIVNSPSLLWALDPLAHTPEGGVTIGCADAAGRERLRDQISLLDPLQQPALMLMEARSAGVPGFSPALDPGTRFEWLAGRQLLVDPAAIGQTPPLNGLRDLAAPDAELRLLDSAAVLGPAQALLQETAPLQATAHLSRDHLEVIAAIEADWLSRRRPAPERMGLLEQEGWELQQEEWSETLRLPIEGALLRRWFQPGSTYRHLLESHGIAAETVSALRDQLRDRQGQSLRQELRHWLTRARLRSPQA